MAAPRSQSAALVHFFLLRDHLPAGTLCLRNGLLLETESFALKHLCHSRRFRVDVLEFAQVSACAAAHGEVEAPVLLLSWLPGSIFAWEVPPTAAAAGRIRWVVREFAFASSCAPANLEVEAAATWIQAATPVTTVTTVTVAKIALTVAVAKITLPVPVPVTEITVPVSVSVAERTAVVSSGRVPCAHVVAVLIMVLPRMQEAAVVAARAAPHRVVVARLRVSKAAFVAARAFAYGEVMADCAIVDRIRLARDHVRSIVPATTGTFAANGLRDVRPLVTVPVPFSVTIPVAISDSLELRNVKEAALVATCALVDRKVEACLWVEKFAVVPAGASSHCEVKATVFAVPSIISAADAAAATVVTAVTVVILARRRPTAERVVR